MKKVNKFELVKHRKTNHVEIDPYKTPSGVQIMIKYSAKNSSKIIMGMHLITFSCREKQTMLKMSNPTLKVNWNTAAFCGTL